MGSKAKGVWRETLQALDVKAWERLTVAHLGLPPFEAPGSAVFACSKGTPTRDARGITIAETEVI